MCAALAPAAYMHFYVGDDQNTTPLDQAGHTLSQVRQAEMGMPPGMGLANVDTARLLPMFPGPDGLLHEVGVYHYQQPVNGMLMPQSSHTAPLALPDNRTAEAEHHMARLR